MEKTVVFNLIILDESGSMSPMTAATISGCNETLNVIRSQAKQNADKIKSFVSIFAFQNGGPVASRYLVKNADTMTVNDLTDKDYRPWGNTPLLDAVGSTLSELKAIAETHENSTAIVTIMTDGYENSSTTWNWQRVAALISQLREIGWTINLVGAEIDVEAMADRMNIARGNRMCYQKAETQSMWQEFSARNEAVMREEADMCCPQMSEELRRETRRSRKFFKK